MTCADVDFPHSILRAGICARIHTESARRNEMSTSYRIHHSSEAHETVLDHDRKDGWVASDESADTQPRGISACRTLSDLAHYALHYSMGLHAGDKVLRLIGGDSPDVDRDEYAIRVLPERYEVVGDAVAFGEAAEIWVRQEPQDWDAEDWEDADLDDDVAEMLRRIMSGD